MQIDQLLQALPFRLRPSTLNSLGADSHAPDKFPACPARISRVFHQTIYQTAQLLPRSRKICAHEITSSFGPAIFWAGPSSLYSGKARDCLILIRGAQARAPSV